MSNLIKFEAHQERFTKIIKAVTGRENADAIAEAEITFLQQRYNIDPNLQKCTPDSLVMCAIQAIRDNLSLNQNSGLVYITPQNVNVGTREKPQWITVASYTPTANGAISIARQNGRILDFTNPKIIKQNGRVVGGSMQILKPSYPEPRWEEFEYDESDINRWKVYSEKKNKGAANPLYTSFNGGIDPEFCRAKIIKRSLAKLGTNVQESAQVLTPMFEVPTIEEKNNTVEDINFDELGDL